MWTCPKCKRIFSKANQPHSCLSIPLNKHFENKDKAKELFNHLVEKINTEVGKCKIVSIPCCIHLFGKYDFLAALPKKDKLEIRFALDRKLDSKRLKQYVAASTSSYKNCIDVSSKAEIDEELISWIKESYNLKG